MGKLPWMKFYPLDWMYDLKDMPLEIEGAWIRICCEMWNAETRGKITKSLDRWARFLGVSEHDANRILKYIGNVTLALHVTESNGDVTVMSRRMMKYDKVKEQTRLRVNKYRETRKCNAPVTREKLEVRSNSKENNIKESRDKSLVSLFEEIENSFSKEELHLKDEFIEYWTAKNDGGKKELWQMQKVFDVKRRYRTFLRNEKKWQRKPVHNTGKQISCPRCGKSHSVDYTKRVICECGERIVW